MIFEKASFINFLKSLKDGSMLIVRAIETRGTKQDQAFETLERTLDETQKKLSAIKDEIQKKEVNLGGIDTQLGNIDRSLARVEDTLGKAIADNRSEPVVIPEAITIKEPAWWRPLNWGDLEKQLAPIKKTLEDIAKKESQILPLEDGKVAVKVDRVGGGGGGARLDKIKEHGKIAYGIGSQGQRVLTNANTWYSVPSTVPDEDYLLIISLESVKGTVRFGFNNTGTPGSSNGNNAASHLQILMPANQSLYYASSNAGDTINWTTKEI